MSTVVAPSLPLVAHDVLRGLYAHRLLSTTHLWELYAHDRTKRWVLMALAQLEALDLVARVRIAATRSRESAWYLRPDGVAITEGPGVEVRGYRMNAARAAGPLQAHTLAVNEVGVILTRAARRFGDDFGSGSWRNETAHRLGAGGTGEVVISDAVVDYTVVEAGHSDDVCRFLELDRATKSVRSLIHKLESYARLAAYPPAWRAYPVFPPIVVVMTGQPQAALERRIDALAEKLPLSSPIANAELNIYATTLAQLRDHGPHAPVFWHPRSAHLVDIRGNRKARR